ncbi:hypothetical protein CEQ21_18115 [Niallia circulans]|uniref:Uncharacterized protein n=1 Tax=Niallia circulans TaxID=1397 RepID=A0A553SK87_NIACI|nr:hypothetical protein [Niallia circulans]TRZ37369.1 hypothetical protein CEQ21_18115 [Niallia circulans]
MITSVNTSAMPNPMYTTSKGTSIKGPNDDFSKDPRFLAFCSLACNNWDGTRVLTDETRLSMSFPDFCDMLDKGELVDAHYAQNNTFENSTTKWELVYKFSPGDPKSKAEQLEIIKKAYSLGMMTNDDWILRKNESLNIMNL